MDKASAYEAGDCGFESRRGLQNFLHNMVFQTLYTLYISPTSYIVLMFYRTWECPILESWVVKAPCRSYAT